MNTVRKPRLFSRTKAAVAVAVTGTIASATVGQQTASADEVWGFRLSNFHPHVTTLCVTTDRANVCTGRIPYGTSRVYDVAFNDPASFRCTAKVDIIGTMQGSFNRNEFKECIAGINNGSRLFVKRPDGSSVSIK